MLNSNISSTSPRNMANFAPLTTEIGSGVWGTPTNFNQFRVFASLSCNDVAQQRSTKLCTTFGRLLAWHSVYTLFGALAP